MTDKEQIAELKKELESAKITALAFADVLNNLASYLKAKAKRKKIATNGDRIRYMTNEELAGIAEEGFCSICAKPDDVDCGADGEICSKYVLEYLNRGWRDND